MFNQKERKFFLFFSFLIFVGFLILNFATFPDTDVKIFYFYSQKIINQKILPYKNFFVVYPPLSLIPILIPGFFSLEFSNYAIIFGFEMTLFLILSYFFFLKIVKKLKMDLFETSFYFILFSLLSYFFILRRFDIFIIFLILSSIYFLLKNNIFLSSLLLCLGVFAKFYPVIILPIFFIYILKNKNLKESFLFLASFLGIFIFLFLIFSFIFRFPIKESGGYSFLYHFQRPIHIESLYGGLLLILNKTKFKKFSLLIKNDEYGWSLYQNPLLKFISYFSTGFLLVIFGIFLLYLLKLKKIKKETFLNYIFLFFLFFVAFNKVFSPQFLIWVFPLASLCLKEKKEKLIFGFTEILTFIIYPCSYKFLLEKNLFLIFVLNLRNFLFLYLSLFFTKKLFFPNKKITKKEIPQKSS